MFAQGESNQENKYRFQQVEPDAEQEYDEGFYSYNELEERRDDALGTPFQEEEFGHVDHNSQQDEAHKIHDFYHEGLQDEQPVEQGDTASVNQNHSQQELFDQYQQNEQQNFNQSELVSVHNHHSPQITEISFDTYLHKHPVDNNDGPLNHYSQSDKEQIEKLKKANSVLKDQLMELNKLVDQQLYSKGVKVASKAGIPKRQPVNDKEKSVQKQIDSLKKQNEQLKRQLYMSNNIDKIVTLENLLKEKKREVDQVQAENISLRNTVREQAKSLEKMNVGQDKTIDQISADYRSLKTRYQQNKEKLIEMKLELDKSNDKVMKSLHRCDKYEQALKSVNLNLDNIALLNKLKQEIDEKDTLINDLKKRIDVETKSKQAALKKMKAEVSSIQTEMKKQQQQNDQVNIGKPLHNKATRNKDENQPPTTSQKKPTNNQRKSVSSLSTKSSPKSRSSKQQTPPITPNKQIQSTVGEEHFTDDFDEFQPVSNSAVGVASQSSSTFITASNYEAESPPLVSPLKEKPNIFRPF